MICVLLLTGLFSACSSNDAEPKSTLEPIVETENISVDSENSEAETEETEAEPEAESPNPDSPDAESEAEENAQNSAIGQTITFNNLDVTFNSAKVVEAKGDVLVINVTIVNNSDTASCIGAARTTLTDSTGERKSTYGFDVDDMTYISDTEVAPGETLEGYLIYFAPDESPATLIMDNTYLNEDELYELLIEFEPLA